MHHEPHIGFVDAHAKGDGGTHHHVFAFHEICLVPAADAGFQPGMIGPGAVAGFHQPVADLFGGRTRGGIDDASATGLPGHEGQQLAMQIVAPHHIIANIGPIKAGKRDAITGNAQL